MKLLSVILTLVYIAIMLALLAQVPIWIWIVGLLLATVVIGCKRNE